MIVELSWLRTRLLILVILIRSQTTILFPAITYLIGKLSVLSSLLPKDLY